MEASGSSSKGYGEQATQVLPTPKPKSAMHGAQEHFVSEDLQVGGNNNPADNAPSASGVNLDFNSEQAENGGDGHSSSDLGMTEYCSCEVPDELVSSYENRLETMENDLRFARALLKQKEAVVEELENLYETQEIALRKKVKQVERSQQENQLKKARIALMKKICIAQKTRLLGLMAVGVAENASDPYTRNMAVQVMRASGLPEEDFLEVERSLRNEAIACGIAHLPEIFIALYFIKNGVAYRGQGGAQEQVEMENPGPAEAAPLPLPILLPSNGENGNDKWEDENDSNKN